MKALALLIATSITAGTTAFAQTAVRGNAAAESQTTVSADRRGANVTSDSRTQAGVAAQRGSGDDASRQAGASAAGASEMDATLERAVDARRAKPGDEVTAKTNEDFTTDGGVMIPRGSRLIGRVTEARPHTRGAGSAEGAAASQLGIVFDKAVLEDGRQVPMQATIGALAAGRSQAHSELGSASHDAGAFGASGASGGGLGGAGGLGGIAGAGVGGVAGNAGAAVGGASRLARPTVAGAAGSAGTAHGGALLGSSAGALGGLGASGQWLAGSRGVFGIDGVSIASAAAGSAQGSLITSTSRHVRLDSGTQLLLVGTAKAGR